MTAASSDRFTATHLVDEMIDWRSQLECEISAWRRAQVQNALQDRAFRIQQYLDAHGE